MPPRRIKKDPKEGWLAREDGELVNPNSAEGLRLRGIVTETAATKPFTEDISPCNAAAELRASSNEDGTLFYL